LIQTGITRLLSWFPDRDFDPTLIGEYNRQSREEWESVRDFLVLHYCATERDDTPFWNHCRTMEVPGSLRFKMEMFRKSGRVPEPSYDLFHPASWVAVLLGQGVIPESFDPMVESVAPQEASAVLSGMREVIAKTAEAMPPHQQFIDRFCRADPLATSTAPVAAAAGAKA
jgi:tryptophan halogenase